MESAELLSLIKQQTNQVKDKRTQQSSKPTLPPRDPDGKFLKFCELTQLPSLLMGRPPTLRSRYTRHFLFALAGIQRLSVRQPLLHHCMNNSNGRTLVGQVSPPPLPSHGPRGFMIISNGRTSLLGQNNDGPTPPTTAEGAHHSHNSLRVHL